MQLVNENPHVNHVMVENPCKQLYNVAKLTALILNTGGVILSQDEEVRFWTFGAVCMIGGSYLENVIIKIARCCKESLFTNEQGQEPS